MRSSSTACSLLPVTENGGDATGWIWRAMPTRKAGTPIESYAWLYRDYVIRAFNADKPYDRFLLEQIAGDELADHAQRPVITQELMDNLVATGFLRLTPDPTSQAESGLIQDRISVISDEIQVFSSGVLGLTIQCAQCHDHKLEPIPQRDYYRLRAVFKGRSTNTTGWCPTSGSKGKPARLLPYVAPCWIPPRWRSRKRSGTRRIRNCPLRSMRLQAALAEKAKPLEKEIIERNLAKQPRGIARRVAPDAGHSAGKAQRPAEVPGGKIRILCEHRSVRPRQLAQGYVSRVPEGCRRDRKKDLVAPISADSSAVASGALGSRRPVAHLHLQAG